MTYRHGDALTKFNVSRETRERIGAYVDLLGKWNKRINLVAPNTLAEVWTRHIADSAQIYQYMPSGAQSWADLGSGGGFPGAVVALMAAEKTPDLKMTLVEADQRKATFLRSVARETGVPFRVIADRIENVPSLDADVVSARALAPLDDLLGLVARHLREGGTALLPKGASWRDERASALEHWTFDCETHPSKTDTQAVILEIGDIKRV